MPKGLGLPLLLITLLWSYTFLAQLYLSYNYPDTFNNLTVTIGSSFAFLSAIILIFFYRRQSKELKTQKERIALIQMVQENQLKVRKAQLYTSEPELEGSAFPTLIPRKTVQSEKGFECSIVVANDHLVIVDFATGDNVLDQQISISKKGVCEVGEVININLTTDRTLKFEVFFLDLKEQFFLQPFEFKNQILVSKSLPTLIL